ncbi:LacI family DNA-binding transcriptional regulator [Lederbergia panacisoli]|uniref:LacI family DNA-binding transcriptional regulator n=1 Tax=Lederbergia panacisoli TaxID=1255251 RepID=UPI00214BBCAF|nr:LacI family DNA-binding transcriptional regulator [Lederbergia panacisoli]MCR2822558.1 LacI family transcriptional regulator [Lederbergia panacisoli]
MKVTISDVAKKAQVSKTTVSRILNGNFAHATLETKNRVLQAIRDLDYRPNALAKGLKLMRTNVIGVILSNLKNPFWTNVLEGVEDASHRMGYHLMICNTNEDQEKEAEYIKEFQRRQVDGIIINPTVLNDELYNQMINEMPVVVINRRISNQNAINVVVDNVKGADLAIRHLIESGSKRIAVFMFNNEYVSPWMDRLKGYQSAMLLHGYTSKDFRILKLDQKSRELNEIIKKYIREHPDVDSIFSTNNMITLVLLDAIRELGLSIPKDLAVVSYDETIWAKYLDPPLTTIKQPGYEMGRIATVNLIQTINGKQNPNSKSIILQPELIVRTSSEKLTASEFTSI